ncbi:MAG: helix-turn-helix domain-containing protein [Ekhidna sp.]|nr:helix-turn-helix domain-containing protein [Ekhidna sp.]MBC6409344.1 helix-turn-helix domain-containing protein [Ekhidna sp.]MBC6425559.1 helix-turn-helix domain-containing protein [Ekhidna sp.]
MSVSVSDKPSKNEQAIAMESYEPLLAVLEQLKEETPEIAIEETGRRIKIPLNTLKLLAKILKATSEGKPVNIIPVEMELTTQAAADYIGCSRPHIVKLLEEKKIPFIKIGRHRRVKMDDLVKYKKDLKEKQRKALIQMMRGDEELKLYDL